MPDPERRHSIKAFTAARLAGVIMDGLESLERSDGVRLLTNAELAERTQQDYDRGYRDGARIMTDPLTD